MRTPPHDHHRHPTEPGALRVVRFAELIRRHIPRGATVLEIGAGEGHLAALLARAGHPVVAIDPDPRAGFPAIASTLEEYDASGRRFDCVVAQLVLHHAADLDAFVAKVALLAKRNGIVAIDDYGWERSADEGFRNDRCSLHPSTIMLAKLNATFDQVWYDDHGYFDEGAGDDRLAFSYIGRVPEAPPGSPG